MAQPGDEMNVAELKEALKQMREEIFSMRQGLDTSWKGLQQKEVEFEETAAKAQMSLGLEHQDKLQKDRIEEIDAALQRMETGDYGVCQSCGRPISPGRLRAIPWTPVCAACAGADKTAPGETPEVERALTGLPPDYAGMSDKELAVLILEKLRDDGRVELEELEIKVESGRIHLDGVLPSEASHELLIKVIQDEMGIHEFEDRIRIDEVSWQREDRQGKPDLKKTEDEELLQGEDVEEEVFHSLKAGKPVIPPDEWVPEDAG
jgi:RNA polymerase-binding transcription factor DksA